jgi:hypothetical protein
MGRKADPGPLLWLDEVAERATQAGLHIGRRQVIWLTSRSRRRRREGKLLRPTDLPLPYSTALRERPPGLAGPRWQKTPRWQVPVIDQWIAARLAMGEPGERDDGGRFTASEAVAG